MDCLGDRIKKLRKRAGITQGHLGKLLGITQARVSRIENGVDNLYTNKQLEPFAKILNTTVEDLRKYQDRGKSSLFYITLIDRKGFTKNMELSEFPGHIFKIVDGHRGRVVVEFELEKTTYLGKSLDNTEIHSLEYYEKCRIDWKVENLQVPLEEK